MIHQALALPVRVAPTAAPLDRASFSAYVIQCLEEFDRALQESVGVPENHDWKNAVSRATWFRGDALRSTINGATFYLGRKMPDERDPKQYMIDIRYFWKQQALVEFGKVQLLGKPQHEAILWCEKGRAWFGHTKNLLGEDESASYYADSIADLAAQVAATVNRLTGLSPAHT